MAPTSADAAKGCVTRYLCFERWQTYLVACFLIYLAGFYLAPTHDFQMRWFYYSVTVIAGFMLIFKGRTIFVSDTQGNLKWFALISFLLFLPFLWTPDTEYLRTVRIGLERWLFVFSFALAVFYCVRKPRLVECGIPVLLIGCAFAALCLLLIKSLSLHQYSNMTGMLLLSGNPNQTGMPLGVGCILSLSLWFSGKLSWRRNLAWGVLVLLFSWGVWITTTRSAMLGLVVAASLILYMKTHRKLVWLIPVTLIVAVVSYVCWHWPNPEHYLFSGRVQIWSHIWSVFKLHPWFGQGAQQTYAVILLGHWKLEAHNLYFGIAYYAGIFGLLTYAVLLWLSVRQGRKLTLQMRWIYFPLLVYGLTVHLFEGIYPIYRPHPFWLFTWLPILVLMLADERKSGNRWRCLVEFDVLVIAMQRETTRRKEIATSLAAVGVEGFHYLDATDGRDAAQLAGVQGYDASLAQAVIGRELTTSEIACFDSHRRSWEWVAKRDKPVLVLESDVQASQDMMTVCRELCVRIGVDLPAWQHVMLHYHQCLPSFWGSHSVTEKFRLVRFANRRVYLASAMLLTREAAEKFLAYGQSIYLPVDDFMTGGYVDKKVELFAVYPPPVTLSWTAKLSNIEDERAAIAVARRAKLSWRRYSLWLRQCWRKIRRPPDWL